MDYTRRLIMESMRLYPPFWWNLRAAHQDDEVGGTRIPAGATVLLVTYATHRHPEFWDDPERFDPDRFLPRPWPRGTGTPTSRSARGSAMHGRHLACWRRRWCGDARATLSRGHPNLAPGRLPGGSLAARAGRRMDGAGGGGSA